MQQNFITNYQKPMIDHNRQLIFYTQLFTNLSCQSKKDKLLNQKVARSTAIVSATVADTYTQM